MDPPKSTAQTPEAVTETQVEIGHVLFIDIVGYSKFLTNEQRERVAELNRIVRDTNAFREADANGKLIRFPTGDGMVLAFFTSPDAPVRCAIAIVRALRGNESLQLRMGIHSGPVEHISDVDDRPNLAGAGVNLAQRVMNCGDAGHVLLSARAAHDLSEFAEWKAKLHVVGEVEVKHGGRVALFNLYDGVIGNAAVPNSVKSTIAQTRRTKRQRFAAAWLIAAAFAAAFAFWLTRTVSLPLTENGIAVLPFENLSGEKENAFLASGIQDEIITRLAKISALKVISRGSTRLYESKPANLRQVGNELGVAVILEGSVQKVGNTIRVNVQLIKAATDSHLWAETYDRELVDVLPLESEIASRIATSLKATLSPDEEKRVNAVATTNPDAYEAYLQGRETVRLASTSVVGPEVGRAQRQLYEKAISLDPGFAVAHAALSENYSFDFINYGASPEKRIKARSEAEEALRLQPDLGEARVALGSYHYRVEKDYNAAASEWAIALRALPNDAELLWSMAMMERRRNHWRAHLEGLHRCLALNPRDLLTLSSLADSYIAVHNYAAAEETVRHQVEVANTISPEETIMAKLRVCDVQQIRTGSTAPMHALFKELPNETSASVRGSVLLDIGYSEHNADTFLKGFAMIRDPDEGIQFDAIYALRIKGDTKRANDIIESFIAKNEDLVRKNPAEAKYQKWLGLWYASAARKEEAIREGRRATELVPEAKDATDGPVMTTNLAMIYAKVGEPDLALNLIEHLLTIPCDGEALQNIRDLQVSWHWDPLRNNPRFQRLANGPPPKIVYN